MMHNKRGEGAVIGVILMVAVSIALAAVVTGIMFGISAGGDGVTIGCQALFLNGLLLSFIFFLLITAQVELLKTWPRGGDVK
jgi:hypothetical protein